ncbi:aldehyde dehydrogenase family protein [Altererythrobacter sp. BO-6]|uniref:aldehyde dehydrogenase family protein n=1 Tax=Altererythrobacter sp. BO-6 TaxID=2604537 RepID=UPI0013E2051A|nr:aldehyde dehydrogenase family protein [Altererythrobacter sp. BO-6]QIG53592.1 aldehyde dehydrogenase family protein [Altererythrobacter sp. BO-6]
MKIDVNLPHGTPILPHGLDWAAGEAQPGQSRLIYAATEEPLVDVPDTSEAQVDAAVARARHAFANGPWRKLTAADRARILAKCEAAVLAHADELATLQALETGIPYAQIRGMHVSRTAENFRFFGELVTSLSGESYEQTGRYLSIVTREPVGVGLLIAPWNAPLVLGSMKMAAAIALGNSVIVKPSEYAPLAIMRLVEILEEAGLPPGVVQVVTGPGASVGSQLVRHPGIDVVGFIGGTATGKRIMADAASGLKKVGLELGGKSANIVLASADFERALDGTILGFLAGNGEQCLSGSRIMVEDSIADRFIEALVARVENVKVGDPFAADTELGPMAFRAHYERVLSFAQEAHASPDYRVLTGAKRAEGFERGYYVAPTVVEAFENSTRLCQEEVFGPFAMVQRVRDLDDALQRANDSEFGLVSYIWSNDLPSVMRARRELQAGTVWVNTPMSRDLRAPFGGYKQSGIGRDGLPGSVELFTEEKTTMIPQEPLDLPKVGGTLS